MDAYEIPLVLFTVLSQWAVGIVIGVTILEWFKPKFMESVGKNSLKKALYTALGVSVLGTIVSMLHLGNPFKGYTALLGTTHSWLSREIIAVITFNVLLVILTYIWWKMSHKTGVRKGLGLLTSLIGVVLVFVSGMVYFQMALHPAWNNWTTFANFLLTGLLLGTLTVTYFAMKGKKEDVQEDVTKFMGSYLGLIVIALLVTIGASFMVSGGAGSAEAAAAISVTSVLFWVRILSSLLIPATLIIYFIVTKKINIVNYVLVAIGFVLIGELSGRALFYYSVMSQYPWV